jgi:hypothetical protein
MIEQILTKEEAEALVDAVPLEKWNYVSKYRYPYGCRYKNIDFRIGAPAGVWLTYVAEDREVELANYKSDLPAEIIKRKRVILVNKERQARDEAITSAIAQVAFILGEIK